jgi:hypothetical protein
MKNITNKKFSRWTVESFSHVDNRKTAIWNCKCECGSERKVSGISLRGGVSKSCGCFQKETARAQEKTHGMSETSIFKTWNSMIRRCNNPSDKAYSYYGGRGIRVCRKWQGKNGFANFFSDMGEKPTSHHSIDRVNNDKGYSKKNCRWATKKQQSENRRSSIPVYVSGIRFATQTSAAKHLGMSLTSFIRKFIKNGAR